jgi:RNA polymerase sigma-70 factor, ECF subfamily
MVARSLRFGLGRLAERTGAEDAVQETYVRVFTGLRDFRAAASLRTWLTRIVLNEAIRRKRRRRDPPGGRVDLRKSITK